MKGRLTGYREALPRMRRMCRGAWQKEGVAHAWYERVGVTDL